MRQTLDMDLDSYELKDLSVSSALLLRRDEQVLLRTRLTPVKMAEGAGGWHEIQITSYSGAEWIERFVGKVSSCSPPIPTDLEVPRKRDTLPRHVAHAYWYDVLESMGLKYGSAFQGLDEISTAVKELKAFAKVSPIEKEMEKYVLHPINMEQCLQILIVAVCKGQGRLMTELSLITAIEHLVVCSGGRTRFSVEGLVTRSTSGDITGDLSVVAEDGHPVMSAKRCQRSSVLNYKRTSEDNLISFVKWDNDATYLNLNQTVPLTHSSFDPTVVIRVLKLLAHKNPKLRILELGDGAEATTPLILNALKSQYGERLYLTYTYAATSLDAAFKTKASLKGFHDFDVAFFDIEQDMRMQTFKSGNYDLIITTDV